MKNVFASVSRGFLAALLLLPLVNVADAAEYVIAGPQCVGELHSQRIEFEGVYMPGEDYVVNRGSSFATVQCWLNLTNGDYGNVLDVRIYYKDVNPDEGDISCFAESYDLDMNVVDQTYTSETTVEAESPNAPVSSIKLRDMNLNNGEGAVLLKVECALPPAYSNYQKYGPNSAPSGIKHIFVN